MLNQRSRPSPSQTDDGCSTTPPLGSGRCNCQICVCIRSHLSPRLKLGHSSSPNDRERCCWSHIHSSRFRASQSPDEWEWGRRQDSGVQLGCGKYLWQYQLKHHASNQGGAESKQFYRICQTWRLSTSRYVGPWRSCCQWRRARWRAGFRVCRSKSWPPPSSEWRGRFKGPSRGYSRRTWGWQCFFRGRGFYVRTAYRRRTGRDSSKSIGRSPRPGWGLGRLCPSKERSATCAPGRYICCLPLQLLMHSAYLHLRLSAFIIDFTRTLAKTSPCSLQNIQNYQLSPSSLEPVLGRPLTGKQLQVLQLAGLCEGQQTPPLQQLDSIMALIQLQITMQSYLNQFRTYPPQVTLGLLFRLLDTRRRNKVDSEDLIRFLQRHGASCEWEQARRVIELGGGGPQMREEEWSLLLEGGVLRRRHGTE